MKKNKNILIVTIVLLIFALVLILNKSKSTIRKELRNFAVEDTSNITKIFLADKMNRCVTLKKLESGDWELNGKYKTEKKTVKTLLKTMLQIEVREPVAKAAHNTVVKLLAAKSTKVEIYQWVYRINLFNKLKLFPHEKLTKIYYVGEATQDNTGTYMLMDNSTEPFVVHIPGFRGYVATRYSTIEKDWRNHNIFKLSPADIKSIKVEFPETPEKSFVFENNIKSFSIRNLITNDTITNYDTVKIINYINAFQNINFEALLNDADKSFIDSVTSSIPMNILTLTEKSGKQTVVKMFHKANVYNSENVNDINNNEIIYDRDRLYALIKNTNDFVIMQFFTTDNIIKPFNFFKK